jgi:hypothetical protein
MRKMTKQQKFEMYSKFAVEEMISGHYMAAYHATLACFYAHEIGLVAR